ncbi:MAG: metallophosphoesterase [Muribaculaceae bacterium]|nr:metallophosphoesterase [Muribaculaceae bacterium]
MARFLIVALAVMILMQGYVAWHVWRILPFSTPVKGIVLALMLAALACMVLQFMSDSLPLGVATAMYEIGNSWLVIMFYLLLAFLLLDIGRLVHLVPASWLKECGVSSAVLTAVMLVTFVGGNIHYHNKQRREINLTTDKPLPRPVRIVMLSDLHAGFHNRRAEVGRWVDMINAERPDLILIAGDLIDGNVRPLLAQGTADELRRLQAPAYACLGNHEYIAGLDRAIDFIRQTGIVLLRDSTATVGGVTVVGRDDRTGRHRKSVAGLMQGVDTAQGYVIMLDHQPFRLEQAEQGGVDLQLSGHTHRGQVWPLNWVTRAMYECDYGSYRRGATRYYVSSGMGIWGGKFRIGTSSEYAVITVTPSRPSTAAMTRQEQ